MGTEPDYVEIAENRVIGSTLKLFGVRQRLWRFGALFFTAR
jgi:hypothetical protein